MLNAQTDESLSVSSKNLEFLTREDDFRGRSFTEGEYRV